MATIIDIVFLQKFGSLFVFLLVLFITYAFLEKSKFFGDEKKGINALIAFFLALLVFLSTKLTAVIKIVLPIFAVLFIIFIFIMLGYQSFGVKGEDITKAVTGKKEIAWVIFLIFLIIIAAVIFKVMNKTSEIDQYGNVVTKNFTDSDNLEKYNQSELDVNYETGIFNPKIIGLVLILLIGAFTVRLLAGNNSGKEK